MIAQHPRDISAIDDDIECVGLSCGQLDDPLHIGSAICSSRLVEEMIFVRIAEEKRVAPQLVREYVTHHQPRTVVRKREPMPAHDGAIAMLC